MIIMQVLMTESKGKMLSGCWFLFVENKQDESQYQTQEDH